MMAQTDSRLNIGDNGAEVFVDLNAHLEALSTKQSGPTEPPRSFPYQEWADTSTGFLKRRDGVNNAWRVTDSLDNPAAPFSLISRYTGNDTDTSFTISLPAGTQHVKYFIRGSAVTGSQSSQGVLASIAPGNLFAVDTGADFIYSNPLGTAPSSGEAGGASPYPASVRKGLIFIAHNAEVETISLTGEIVKAGSRIVCKNDAFRIVGLNGALTADQVYRTAWSDTEDRNLDEITVRFYEFNGNAKTIPTTFTADFYALNAPNG